jgi:hypothetical protein
MSRLDDLPPDQHAALGLLLRQGKSYAEVAELLGIRQIAIHDRVHAALAVLAPQQARMLTAPRREEVGNFLLGQEPDESRRQATRAYLASSEEGRAWARTVADELTPLSDRPLSAVLEAGDAASAPAGPEPDGDASAAIGDDLGAAPGDGPATDHMAALKTTSETPPSDSAEKESSGRGLPPGPAREDRPRPPRRERPPRRDVPARQPGQRSSTPDVDAPGKRSGRRAGALLLGLIAVVVAVAVILITRGGSHSEPTEKTASVSSTSSVSSSSSTSSSVSTTRTTTTTKSGGPKTEARLALTPRKAGSKASATVEILSEDGKHAFYISARNLPPSKGFFYAVWLYNSPTESRGLGRAPAVGSSGRLEGGLLLPSNASSYHEMLLTEETTTTPSHPGPIVLSGPFSLH